LKRVIITGDDFGLALPVNEAIEEAHLRGSLTTASLMVGAKSSKDAAERARNLPSLRVGLHLTLVEGNPVLPPQSIPDLVDSTGMFPSHLTRSGFRFFFLPGIRNQIEAEIRAQFETFQRTGLLLDHVNAHNHMHLHPTVLRLILKVGKDYGLKAIRLPYEPPLRSWRAAGTSPGSRFVSWAFLFPWINLMKAMMRQAGVRYNDFLFGMNDSGAMNLDLALRLVRALPDGVTELCFHPASRRCAEIDCTMPRYMHEDEFKALTSEALIQSLKSLGLQPIAFSDL
jgi:hopanoid biosynthesis associated protein HpnK